MNKIIFCLVGASGVGKSTILNYIRNTYNIKVNDVSARPFLPPDKSYIEGSNEQNQVLISQHRFLTFIEAHFHKIPTFFARSPIDSLAYSRALNCATYMDKLLNKQIEIAKTFIKFFYIPIEFGMEDSDDIVRGVDQEVQKKTDEFMQQIMKEHHIKPVKLSGTKRERFDKIDELLGAYKKEDKSE